jgi:release factor glutamine methyltransferase
MRIASNKLKDMISFYFSELKANYETSEIEAMLELAAEQYIGFSKTDLLTKSNENLNQSDVLKLYDCCKALKQNIPIQYILKNAWFYQFKFYVDESVLIPRPETEELVDMIIKENKNAFSFLDIGTGSGCIPVSIKKNIPAAAVFACDISPKALEVATKNALQNQVQVTYFEANVLDIGHFVKLTNQRFDVIVSNPPYIKESEKNLLAKNVFQHEPHLALFVEGTDDIVFYKRIVDICNDRLNSGGCLYFELNPLTAELVKDYAVASTLFKHVELFKDMSGKTRFLKAIKK